MCLGVIGLPVWPIFKASSIISTSGRCFRVAKKGRLTEESVTDAATPQRMLSIELISSIKGNEKLRIVAVLLAVVGASNQPPVKEFQSGVYFVFEWF